MLRALICALSIAWLYASSEAIEQALTWQGVQKQLMSLHAELKQLLDKKTRDNKDFFNLQQQLGAIYLAQKRYHLGFGTAFIPHEQAVQNYVRKKTFLDLKSKELLPTYKARVLEYQKRYTTGELERLQKNVQHLEALNLLHLRLFYKLNTESAKKSWVNLTQTDEIESIKDCITKMPTDRHTKTPDHHTLGWIIPVAGERQHQLSTTWQPFKGAVVLCPDHGMVAAIHRLEGAFVIFIKQQHFTYAVKGFERCCVKVGDKLKQGEPLGMCSSKAPGLVELQLWHDSIALDPQPYCHEVCL